MLGTFYYNKKKRGKMYFVLAAFPSSLTSHGKYCTQSLVSVSAFQGSQPTARLINYRARM